MGDYSITLIVSDFQGFSILKSLVFIRWWIQEIEFPSMCGVVVKVSSVKMARFVQCQPVTPLKFYRMRFTRLPPFPLGFGHFSGQTRWRTTFGGYYPHLSAQF